MADTNTAPRETLETVLQALALQNGAHKGPDGREYPLCQGSCPAL